MGNVVDITGQVFGRLTVLRRSETKNPIGRVQWVCRCQCGATVQVQTGHLNSGHTKSCGCLAREMLQHARHFLDLTGQTFHRWTVLRRASNGTKGQPHWLCECVCGTRKVIVGASLRSGNSKSCGCWNRESARQRMTTHGMRNSPEYRIWMGMINRCHNPKNRNFPRYGGRGIVVCHRWQTFSNFWLDMGPRPSPKHSIERRSNDGPYAPTNCIWADAKTQARNKRTNHLVSFAGQTKTLAEWAEEYQLSPHTLFYRLTKLHWSIAEALTVPCGVRKGGWGPKKRKPR